MATVARMTYNSVDLSGAGYDVEVEDVSIPSFPTPRIDIQSVPYGGGISQGKYYEPFQIAVQAVILGTSVADLQDNCQAVAAVFDVDADKSLVFDYYDNTIRWMARLTDSSSAKVSIHARRFRWTFTCPNPIAEDASATSEVATPDSDSYTFYVPASGNLGGNYEATPAYTIKANGACAASVKLKNVTRDEEIEYAAALINGDWLEIDTALWTVRKSTDSGTSWTNVIGNCTASPFPKLDDGAHNEMLLTNCDNSTITTSYRARYIGG